MTKTTRERAYRALLNAKTCGNKYFPQVYVCGTHVYFTFDAAEREKNDYLFFMNVNMPIEIVTIREAFRYDKVAHPDWLKEVDWNINSK